MTTLEKVIKSVSEETGADDLSANTFLDSLGLDSIGFASLMVTIRKEIADIPDVEWININTVGSLAQVCERYL